MKPKTVIDWKHYPEPCSFNERLTATSLDAWAADENYWYVWLGMDTPDSPYYLGFRGAI